MDLYFNSSQEDIEELVKTSKQLQNKMQQELRRQAMSSTHPSHGNREEVPPIWDKFMLNPYVGNVVADYLIDSKSFKLDVQTNVENSEMQDKVPAKESIKGIFNSHPVTKAIKLQNTNTIRGSQNICTDFGNELAANKVESEKFVFKKVHPKVQNTLHPFHKHMKAAQPTVSKKVPSEVSLNPRKSYKSSIKSLDSIHRLPLQRFAKSYKNNIDFTKEHPNLELDTCPNQTTLFPRRVHRASKTIQSGTKTMHREAKAIPPLRDPADDDSINLAQAKTTAVSTAFQRDTWKDMLLKNKRSREKLRNVPQLPKGVEASGGCKKILECEIKEPKAVDVIITPANGLFVLENQTTNLSKQKNCKLQHFPVLYIRPERRVQRVANISIGGDGEANRMSSGADDFLSNVKYIECTHKEENVELRISPPKAKKDEMSDEVILNENNKFFKALKCTERSKDLPASTVSLSSNSKSSCKGQQISSDSSTYSRSASKVQQLSSLASIEASDNYVHDIFDTELSSTCLPDAETTKDLIRNIPSRREAYVQTDFEEIPPPPELTASIINKTFSSPHRPPLRGRQQTAEQEDQDFVADDFITNIFERIRNDVPTALQAFKDRKTTPHEETPLEYPTIKKPQKQMQRHQRQMSTIRSASSIEMIPKEIQPRLAGSSHAVLQMPVDSPVLIRRPHVVAKESRTFLLPQQNRIKSSAVRDEMPSGYRIKEGRQKYPTDAEIKRAVKMFLDALTLEDSGGCGIRKSIIKNGRAPKCASFVDLNPPNSSSSCSSIGNYRDLKPKPNIFQYNVSRSGTSTETLFTDSDTESDVIVEPKPGQLSKTMANSLSDGEVLSMGEI